MSSARPHRVLVTGATSIAAAAALTAREAIRHMRAGGGGSIVLTAPTESAVLARTTRPARQPRHKGAP